MGGRVSPSRGGRAGHFVPQRAAQYLLELVGGQVGLATPIVFAMFAAGLWQTVRRRDWLLGSLAVPGLLLFAEHAIGARVQANWLAILYPPLAIGAAAVLTRWRPWAAGLGFALTAVVYLQATLGPIPLPRRLDPTVQRLGGWAELAADADAMRRAQGLGFVAADEYGIASELAWWSPRDATVIGAEARWQLFDLPSAKAGTGLLLISERRREEPDPAVWRNVEQIGRLTRARRGVEAEAFRVYRATSLTNATAVQMPRPGGE